MDIKLPVPITDAKTMDIKLPVPITDAKTMLSCLTENYFINDLPFQYHILKFHHFFST